MSFPPLFQILHQNATIAELVGDRIYAWGAAPKNTPGDYITWHVPAGSPYNTLGGTVLADRVRVQLDLWMRDPVAIRNLHSAVVATLEGRNDCYLVLRLGGTYDPDSRLFRETLDFEFILDRPPPPVFEAAVFETGVFE